MRDLTELNKLEQYLKEKGIPYEREDEEERFGSGLYDFHQICVPCKHEGRQWDVVCHRGSYGAEKGLLEIMGSIVRTASDTVEGWLTAVDVIARIEEEMQKEEQP